MSIALKPDKMAFTTSLLVSCFFLYTCRTQSVEALSVQVRVSPCSSVYYVRRHKAGLGRLTRLWRALRSPYIQLSGSSTQTSKNMTRITSFGRKRTYVEAGFKSDPVEVEEPSTAVEDAVMVSKEDNSTIVPPKKKRKRMKKPKAHIGDSGTTRMLEESVECIAVADERDETHNISAVDENLKKAKRKSNQKNDKKAKGALPAIFPLLLLISELHQAASWRAEQSELRRQQRIAERLSNTICFACRKKGHAAKDCPDSRVEDDTLEGEAGDKVVQVVGICYRYDIVHLYLVI